MVDTVGFLRVKGVLELLEGFLLFGPEAGPTGLKVKDVDGFEPADVSFLDPASLTAHIIFHDGAHVRAILMIMIVLCGQVSRLVEAYPTWRFSNHFGFP